MNRFCAGLILIMAVAMVAGCVGRPDSPVTPSIQRPSESASQASNSRQVWGLYDVTIRTETGEVEATLDRTAMFRCNVNNLMEQGGPKHLKFMNMDVSKFASEGRLSLDVGLEHPFPGLDNYTGFDVWGVFMHDGGGVLSYDSLSYPMAGVDGILENADGYTRWFNMNEFSGPPIVGYTPGVVGTPGFEPSAHLNGYRVFADGLQMDADLFAFLDDQYGFQNRCEFRAGFLFWRTYKLRFPIVGGTPDLKFQYAVLASWAPPLDYPPLIPEDFPLDANIQEANAVTVAATEVPWFVDPGNWGGDLTLEVKVYDWQGAMENPAGIPGEIADVKVAGNFLPATWDGGFTVIGGGAHYSTVQVEIPESFMSPDSATGNECFVMIESVDPPDYSDDGLIPSGAFPESAKLAAFVRAGIEFGTEPQTHTIDLVDITPPGWPAVARDVWVDNDVAYVVGPYGGLVVFDVSGSGDPVYIGGFNLPGEGNEVQVEGDYCYVADGSAGLEVLNITDPTEPALVGSFVGTDAEGLYVAGGYCYLADGKGDLKILDIGGGSQGGSPEDPKVEGIFDVSYAAIDVFVQNGIAYVSDLETSFDTVDIGGGTQGGSPSNPKLEGFTTEVQGGDEIIVKSGYAYVAYNPGAVNRICTIDVNTPSSPTVVGQTPVTTYVYDIWIDGNYMYAAAYLEGLKIYSIPASEPPIPSHITDFDTDGYSMGVYKTGNYAYVADYDHGLVKVDVSDPAKPAAAGGYFTPRDPYDVQVLDDYVYCADDGMGLEVLDVGGGGAGTPQQPLAVGLWDNADDARGVWVENGYAYLGGGWFNSHFYVIDVGAGAGSPDNPIGIADLIIPTWQGTLGLMKMGSYVYATAWEDGLKVFDVDGGVLGGSPSNPKYVTTKPTNCSWGLWTTGGYVYLADGNNIQARFYVFDAGGGGVGTPSSPVIADYVDTPNHNYDVEVVDGYAYVCGGDGLAVYDVGASIGAPDDIQQVGTYYIAWPTLSRGLCVSDGYAFIVTSDGQIYCIDVGGGQAGGSPTDPQYVDSITVMADCFDIQVDGQYGYVVSSQGGLRIIQLWE